MTIDTSCQWWRGSEAKDLGEYLAALTEDGCPTDEFRLVRCSCGTLEFSVAANAVSAVSHLLDFNSDADSIL